MNAKQKKLAEKILDTLEGARFEDWYNGLFEDYIGDSDPKYNGGQTNETVLVKITELFKL